VDDPLAERETGGMAGGGDQIVIVFLIRLLLMEIFCSICIPASKNWLAKPVVSRAVAGGYFGQSHRAVLVGQPMLQLGGGGTDSQFPGWAVLVIRKGAPIPRFLWGAGGSLLNLGPGRSGVGRDRSSLGGALVVGLSWVRWFSLRRLRPAGVVPEAVKRGAGFGRHVNYP